jgi:hypothetical protein
VCICCFATRHGGEWGVGKFLRFVFVVEVVVVGVGVVLLLVEVVADVRVCGE